MKYQDIHPWTVSYSEAVAIQERLRQVLESKPLPGAPVPGASVPGAPVAGAPVDHPVNYVAGADVSYSRGEDRLFAAVIVFTFPNMEIVEQALSEGQAGFPYIPGLLTFREAPILLSAFTKLRHDPDVILFDGQGIAHPRRLGLASHLGVILGCPTIGCAKSRLIGKYAEPGEEKGDRSPLQYEGETIGMVLRTRRSVKPVFVSIGHMIDLDTAISIVLACTHNYRLPEPTRQAHLLANRLRRRQINP